MLRLFGILVVPAAVIGLLTGAGPLAIVGGFVALFSFIGVAGGALWPDLRTLAALSPLFALGAIGPRLLADVARPAAFVLILVLIAVAALLPLRRPHLATSGLGLGLATLISYGLPVGGADGQLVLAVVVGLGVSAVFRLLSGVADPHRATREKVAALLDADEPSLSDAVDLWLRDGRPRWLVPVVETAVALRVALAGSDAAGRRGVSHGASEGEVTRLRDRVRRLADDVRAASAPAGGPGRSGAPGTPDAALALAEAAVRDRDTAPAQGWDGARERLDRAVALRRASWRSAQVRHAVRTTIGVLVALLVSLTLRPGDPLLVTLLMTVFSILQTSWSATLDRARPKIIGLVIGAAVTAVLVALLPPVVLVPVALVCLLVGLGNITSRPLLGNAALVVVSVGFNSSLRALDPWATLAEYAVLTVVAVVVGVVVGFGLVPGLRPPPLRARLDDAVARSAAALRATVATTGRPWTSSSWQEALRAREELVADRGPLDDEQADRLDRVRVGLGDLLVLAVLATRRRSELRDIVEAAQRLEHGAPPPAGDRVGVLPALADELHGQWRALDAALGPRRDTITG